MHILCTICSDLVNQADSLYVTKCGHIFHHQCLAQWIERSKSCPQCRNKVTDRCMFRMYPTVSNESSDVDAATLQSRLDDAMLQLRTQRTAQAELQDKLAAFTQDLSKKDELLRAVEKRLVSRESAAAALREQLEYARLQGGEAQRLRQENEALQKNLQTLNGLQKVLNATAGEVEDTLRGYSDLRTLATFAAALKRALCSSEAARRAGRQERRDAEARLAAQRARLDDLHDKLLQMRAQLARVESARVQAHKRKASGEEEGAGDSPPRGAKLGKRHSTPDLNDAIVGENDSSFGAPARGPSPPASASESPYLALKQSGLALGALQRRPQPPHLKPSEFALLKGGGAPTSIFHRAPPPRLSPAGEGEGAGAVPPPDGLGGRARPDVFPAPARPLVPRLSARHRLRRPAAAAPPAPAPAGSRDIAQMFATLKDK